MRRSLFSVPHAKLPAPPKAPQPVVRKMPKRSNRSAAQLLYPDPNPAPNVMI